MAKIGLLDVRADMSWNQFRKLKQLLHGRRIILEHSQKQHSTLNKQLWSEEVARPEMHEPVTAGRRNHLPKPRHILVFSIFKFVRIKSLHSIEDFGAAVTTIVKYWWRTHEQLQRNRSRRLRQQSSRIFRAPSPADSAAPVTTNNCFGTKNLVNW